MGRAGLLGAAAALASTAALLAAPAGAGAASCAPRTLVVWLDTHPGPAAGSTYYKLEFTNLSARTCTLYGYPGVSAAAVDGRRLGAPASRDTQHPPRSVVLPAGGSAFAQLQITQARNFPRGVCRPAIAAGLRVYPPGATKAQAVPFPFLACTRGPAVVLHIEAVQRDRRS